MRTTGSHRIFKHPALPKVVAIAGKSNQDVPIGTLKQVLKDAGIEDR
jgi:predicted RNA binding protein YcfA (HicA-like mRNA interferase family)